VFVVVVVVVVVVAVVIVVVVVVIVVVVAENLFLVFYVKCYKLRGGYNNAENLIHE
jgi:hypothetical protein